MKNEEYCNDAATESNDNYIIELNLEDQKFYDHVIEIDGEVIADDDSDIRESINMLEDERRSDLKRYFQRSYHIMKYI